MAFNANSSTDICKIIEILDRKEIKFSSIDVVRFHWDEPLIPRYADSRDESVTSPVTIWIGVLPGSTNADEAFDVTQDILELLKRHEIEDIIKDDTHAKRLSENGKLRTDMTISNDTQRLSPNFPTTFCNLVPCAIFHFNGSFA